MLLAPSARGVRARTLAATISVALAASLLPGPSSAGARPKLGAYRGLGAWVDIYDRALLADPEGTVLAMKAYGVRSIYIETANYASEAAILYPDALGRFIDAGHAQGMRVVAWYLPSFARLKRDLNRSLAAIEFRSGTGQAFDSFALDIEASVVTDPAARGRRLLALSSWIREAVGPGYPLGAITPNPLRVATDTRYWPGFPYAELAHLYDAFVPMIYFGSVAQGQRAAHDYTARGIGLIREGTGDPTVPIHAIGGVANDLNALEVRGFVQAAREHGVLGASLYDVGVSGAEDWAEVIGVPVNPRQSPALPVPIGYAGALGNVKGEDRTHPQEVFYAAVGAPGSWDLSFQAFDVQPDEVRLLVNWQEVAVVERTRKGAWGITRTVRIDDASLRDVGTNYIAFVAAGIHPDWSTWGVRAVSLTPAT